MVLLPFDCRAVIFAGFNCKFPAVNVQLLAPTDTPLTNTSCIVALHVASSINVISIRLSTLFHVVSAFKIGAVKNDPLFSSYTQNHAL